MFLFIPPPKVLDLSTNNDYGLVRQDSPDCHPIFIDEFRLLVLTYDHLTEDPELVVFNTLIPQDHPNNARRFIVLPGPDDRGARILVDCDRPLGILDMDEPLVADPAQAIFVMEFASSQGPSFLVVVRTQALIEHVCSPRTDFNVPWDVWGKGAVVMELPTHCHYVSTFVHGTKAMVQTVTGFRVGHHSTYGIHTFDFSRRGCSSLQLLNEEGGGTEREALLFKDGWNFEFNGIKGMSPWDTLESLGDGSLFYLVSCFYRSIRSKVVS